MIVSGRNIRSGIAVSAPPSKSVYHRELIIRFLCGDRSCLEPASGDSDDIIATKDCLKALVSATPGSDVVLPCNESGSTLRFMIPVAAAFLLRDGCDTGCRIIASTKGRLYDRPIKELADAMAPHGISIERDDASRSFVITGTMTPGRYEIDGGVSSQYISGLLMAIPLLDEDSSIVVTGEMKSVHYIELTTDAMRRYGCDVTLEDNVFCPALEYSSVTGGSFDVEGDWSNGAFLLCLKYALEKNGSSMTVGGLDADSRQGDRAILDFLDLVSHGDKEITFDCSDIPDIAPYMAITSAFAFDRAELTGIGRLRIKESDRVAAVREQLAAFGIMTEEEEDKLTVFRYGGNIPYDGQTTVQLSSFHDHRMAMCAILLAAFLATEVDIDDIDCLNKSFPQLITIIDKEMKP